MTPYTAMILGPDGLTIRLDILAADMQHARELSREHGAGLFGRRHFTFVIRRQE